MSGCAMCGCAREKTPNWANDRMLGPTEEEKGEARCRRGTISTTVRAGRHFDAVGRCVDLPRDLISFSYPALEL